MKTAVCFTGQCRSLEFTHTNIKRNLLDCVGEHDIFMYISENQSSHKASKHFSPTKIIINPDKPLPIHNIHHAQAEERGGLNGYMQMLYAMKKCNQMRLQHEKENNFKYDRIIRSRLDVKYFNKLPPEYNDYDIEKSVFIPDFHCWSVVQGRGYNDRFAIGNRENMNVYLSEYDYVRKYSSLGHIVHAESTLYYHLNYHNISVKNVPIRFTRVRPGGKEEDHYIRNPPETWPLEERCQ